MVPYRTPYLVLVSVYRTVPYRAYKKPVKGQCRDVRFFSWISFPQVAEYPIRAVLSFFENSWRYSQLKVYDTSDK